MMREQNNPVPREAGISKERVWNWFDYHSVFSYRYSSPEMRRVWSEGHKAELMAEVWIGVAAAQNKAGKVSDEEVKDLRDHKTDFVGQIDEALSREMNTDNPNYSGHDIISNTTVYAEVAPIGGRIIHRPLTSEDSLSNVEVMQMKEGVEIIEAKLRSVLGHFGVRIDELKDLPALGQTHMQAAEPIAMGLRIAGMASDFLMDFHSLQELKSKIKGKGIKGPVGTMAEISKLLENTEISAFDNEKIVMDELGLEAFTVTGQTYPRKLTAAVTGVLANIGVSAKKFGMNMRNYQSALFDELEEPRNSRDRGSSAMPHKRNPRHSEAVMALSRSIKFKHMEAQEVAQDVVMERGIDDSAGKRSFLPEAFLAADEVLGRIDRIVRGFTVHNAAVKRNLHNFGPFLATAEIMTTATEAGASRIEMHEKLFDLVTEANDNMREVGVNNFGDLVKKDLTIGQYLSTDEIDKILSEAEGNIGRSREICERFLQNDLYPALTK